MYKSSVTMDNSVLAGEESSFVSFMLDQEEYTLEFGPETTIQMIEDGFKNATYTEVEFNRCPSVSIDALCTLIPFMNSNLKSLVIRNTPWLNDECIEMVTAYCNKLYKIELHGTLVNITRSGIESIARNSGTLLSLSIVSAHDDESAVESDNDLGEISWNLDNCIFAALINTMTSKLRHFCLSGFNMLTIDGLEKFLSYFRNTLQSVDFSELNMINDSVLKSIGEYCHSLFVLKLNQCKLITDQGIESLFQRPSNLEVLELCGCTNLTDACFTPLAMQSPKLTVIKLDWCVNVTELGLRTLSTYCKKLSYISMKGTGLKSLPTNLSRLLYLNNLNVSDCEQLIFPSKTVINKGLHEIKDTLMKYDIENRVRLTALGSIQCGKTSILLSLQSDNNVAYGPTTGVPVNVWFPNLPNPALSNLPEKFNECGLSLSVELWDCSGRKALEGIHAYFFCKQSIYVVCFNVNMNTQTDKVSKYVNTIQSTVPGSTIILVASHCDLLNGEKVKAACQRVLQKVQEEEENQVREISEELMFLRDLGLFAMIGSKRRKLEWMLENRPTIYPTVLCVSSLTGEGVEKFREVVLSIALEQELHWRKGRHIKELERIFFELMKWKKDNVIFVTWQEMKGLMQHCDIIDEQYLLMLLGELKDMGCVLFMREAYLTNEQNTCVRQPSDMSLPSDSALFCVNPHLFAECVAAIYRDEKNVQDLVIRLQREGHVDTLWTGPKPNDWTLRTTFQHITEVGMIRESIIPLLVNMVAELPVSQLEYFVSVLRDLYIIVEGAPNTSYDVELILPNMKNFVVFKRYFMPLQGLLPVIPQVNAWLPKCPTTHVQVGWDYRFVSSVPANLFLYIISACTVVKADTETISYWQTGAYIRSGTVDVSVCQWKDKLVLQVLARSLIGSSSRQAVNKAWSILAKYLHNIELFLGLFPGLYYEVLALSNSHCKPILEVIDEYEAGDISENEALWDVPLRGCSRNTIRSASIPPNYMEWLKVVAEQTKIHISHSSTVSKEILSIARHLQSVGYEVTKGADNEDDIVNARSIICILTPSYFSEDRLLSVKNNIKGKKIILAVFEQVSVENQGYEDILLNKAKVDICGGKGAGISYQADIEQLNNLVDLCNTTIFGHGSLGDDLKRSSVATAVLSKSGGHVDSPSLTKKPFEQFSDIVKQFSDMSNEQEIKHVAATAVAAAVATATAEHISKQSNPTMGAKAAAMAAEVADAVAKGDSERASKAVIATAKAVDEVVAFSTARQLLTNKPTFNNNKETSDSNIAHHHDRRKSSVATPKSSMCVIV